MAKPHGIWVPVGTYPWHRKLEVPLICQTLRYSYYNGPLTWYMKLRVAIPHHRLQRKPRVSDPGMHHNTCLTACAVQHAGIVNSRWRGKRSRHDRRMRNPQFYVSGKRPMTSIHTASCCVWYMDIYPKLPRNVTISMCVTFQYNAIRCILQHVYDTSWKVTGYRFEIYVTYMFEIASNAAFSCLFVLVLLKKTIFRIFQENSQRPVSQRESTSNSVLWLIDRCAMIFLRCDH